MFVCCVIEYRPFVCSDQINFGADSITINTCPYNNGYHIIVHTTYDLILMKQHYKYE